jgi:molybdopterin-binding protein
MKLSARDGLWGRVATLTKGAVLESSGVMVAVE